MGRHSFSVIRNTAANYLALIWRMVAAIFLVRILFLGLGGEDYGFWTLLWVIFGYSLMLDFGFGQTIQKFTAEAMIDRNMDRLNRIISSIIASYMVMALLILAVTVCLTPFLDKIFSFDYGTDEERLIYLKTVFLVFGVGAAAVFPSGVFPEILAGMKRYDIKNAALLCNITLQLTGIYLLLQEGYSLLGLAVFCSLLNLGTNALMAWGIVVMLPGFHPSPRLISFKTLREISNFSFYVYILNLARLMMGRCDKIVLGIMLGMNAVAVYQVGTRISELMEKLTTQFQDTLGPLAASYYKNNDWESLKWVMLKSGKVAAFITCGAVMILFLLTPPILMLWLKVNSPDVIFITRSALLVIGINILFRSTPEKLLLMAGRHKRIAGITLVESLICLGLSIALVYWFGVKGIVFAPLLPAVIISGCFIVPLLSREFRLPIRFYLSHVFLPLPVMLFPPALGLALLVFFLRPEQWNLVLLGGAAVSAGLLYALLGYLLYLAPDERRQITDKIRHLHHRHGKGSATPPPGGN